MEEENEKSRFSFEIDLGGILVCILAGCGIKYLLGKRKKSSEKRLVEVERRIQISTSEIETLMKLRQLESKKKNTSVTRDVAYLDLCLKSIKETSRMVQEAIHEETDEFVIDDINEAFETFCKDVEEKYSLELGEFY